MLRFVFLSCVGCVLLVESSRAENVRHVDVAIHEGVSQDSPWDDSGKATTSYSQPFFAWNQLPRRYVSGGLIGDRSNPFLLRATARLELPPGQYELLLRSKNVARVLIDGQVAVEQSIRLSRNADGHEETPDLPPPVRPNHRPPPPGHRETTRRRDLGGEHEIVVEAIVGGKGLRADLGELLVAIRGEQDDMFRVVSPDPAQSFSLTENAWAEWSRQAAERTRQLNNQHRRQAASAEDKYWRQRHELARQYYANKPATSVPPVAQSQNASSPVDRFILKRLAEQSIRPAPVCNDEQFLRRVTLDTVGVVPSVREISRFNADEHPDRRARLIDRLLDDPRWADHWVSYWQDVLAENPNILKASLNNTGPFRWWIYESFLDNKSMDRWVTELILMKGSKYRGGPAGFGMATQNDVPEANKALILSGAFLATNLNCARCHDSPTNDYTQKQLFSLAAMLRGEALKLPSTSTVQIDEDGRQPLIEISLKPGVQILPHWSLEDLTGDELPAGVLRDASNPREWLAAILTSPNNERFAQVIVNRLWHRLIGRGIVDSVDDWHGAAPTHPELLEYLSRELVTNNYNLKHVAKLILKSQTYQRQVSTADSEQRRLSERWFASATRRRMSAEQVFDSLFAVAGKEVHAEQLTMDPEGRRPISSFLNLGTPQRAWQFSSLSNERDRPALSLPVAQSANDLLKAFGWREARQDAATVRDETTTPLQPLVLANGTMGRRLVGLSDDHAVTALCLSDLSIDELVDQLFMSVLTRHPKDSERAAVTDFLVKGFESRVITDAKPIDNPYAWQRHPVSWSNHLHAKSSEIMLALENRARQGDPPTQRLDADWRERVEDLLWALTNSAEFIHVP